MGRHTHPETHCSRSCAWNSREHVTLSICRDGPLPFCFPSQYNFVSFEFVQYTYLRPTQPSAHEHCGHAQVRNMPKGERIALVACQACRTCKSRISLLCRASFNVCGRAQLGECDGMTPVCGPCQVKHTYSSDHTFSRFTALKSKYEQLKSSYGNLYERLKHGSASECQSF